MPGGTVGLHIYMISSQKYSVLFLMVDSAGNGGSGKK
jgi:hypothetical protein